MKITGEQIKPNVLIPIASLATDDDDDDVIKWKRRTFLPEGTVVVSRDVIDCQNNFWLMISNLNAMKRH